MESPRLQMYGSDLRPVRPGKPSYRSPVIKLGGSSEFNVPGPGAYTPSLSHKGRASEWIMGDRAARKSSVEPEKDSPGPVYQMRTSIATQMLSNKVSSPRFGFQLTPLLGRQLVPRSLQRFFDGWERGTKRSNPRFVV